MKPMTLSDHIQSAQDELVVFHGDNCEKRTDGIACNCGFDEQVSEHLTSLFNSLKEQTELEEKEIRQYNIPTLPGQHMGTNSIGDESWNLARQETLNLWDKLL